MAIWTFNVVCDPDAKLWVAVESDLPGVAAEGDTLEAVAAKLDRFVPLMLEENAHLIEPDRRAGPHEFRLVARHEMRRRAAA